MSATATKLYLQSSKDPTKRYEIIAYDSEAKKATIRGKYGAFQMQPFTKEAVTKAGYTMVRE